MTTKEKDGLIAKIEKQVEYVRHYIHLQHGKPKSISDTTASEIALGNLKDELIAAVRELN
jgi:hypothetical protein